jgi:hypothetical protein
MQDIQSIISNFQSNNYTTSSNGSVTTITVPYNVNGDKVSFYILYDSLTNIFSLKYQEF